MSGAFAYAAELLADPDDRADRRKWLAEARPKQLPPPGDWFAWVVMAGRGFGKTRTGTEWLDDEARRLAPGDQVLLAGRTPSDVRDYALKGPGGLLTHHRDVQYFPSKRLLLWPNGVEGLIRSGANPEEFRGFSGRKALLDEFAAWQYARECWDNLMFGLREGDPQLCLTTTPRPIEVLREVIGMTGTVTVTGSSYENRDNLSDKWVREVLDRLAGTRLGRQEIEAELFTEVEGALWTLELIDAGRVASPPPLTRVVVAIDPQGVKAEGSETGIVAAGLDARDHVYILADASINGSPYEWGHAAVALYQRLGADRLVGERNYGGEMVEATIRAVDKNASFKLVTATRGKRQRAEPVAAVYEQGRGHHVGVFPALEDEMRSWSPESGSSPNRMDALVWAVSELLDIQPPKLTKATWGSRRG